MITLRKKKAQSAMEYAVLISIISAALIAMQVYITRSMNARLKNIQEEMNESMR